MTPRIQALAFRIWQTAEPRGWDVTMSDIADAIGSHPSTVGKVLKAKRIGVSATCISQRRDKLRAVTA